MCHISFRHTHVCSVSFLSVDLSFYFWLWFQPQPPAETNILPLQAALVPQDLRPRGRAESALRARSPGVCVCVSGGGGGGGVLGGRGAMCRSVPAGGFGALLTGLLLPRSPGVSGFPNRTSLVPLRAGPVPGCQEVTVPLRALPLASFFSSSVMRSRGSRPPCGIRRTRRCARIGSRS